jgi:hypothetical protein
VTSPMPSSSPLIERRRARAAISNGIAATRTAPHQARGVRAAADRSWASRQAVAMLRNWRSRCAGSRGVPRVFDGD